MEKIAAFIEKHIAPIANALGMNRYVVAIQNAFLTLVPFMTIGSFALIITSPPVDYTTMEPGFGQAFFQGWQALADATMLPLTIVNNATMGVLSIWAAIGLSFFLARHYKMTSFLPVALGVAAFLEMAAIDVDGALSTAYFGGTGLFAAILISFVSVEFYRFLSERKIGYIDLSGQGIPPALSDSIGNLVPAAIVLVVFGVLSGVVINLTGAPFPSLISLVMAPLVGVLAAMERTGMYVDPERLTDLADGLGAEIDDLARRIRTLAGDETFNIASPMQLSHILFDVMGLPTRGLKKTARGYYSTNARVLEELARDNEFVQLVLEYREKTKIKSTYLDTLGALRRADGRVHTTYNQTITATGRLSSSNPNLQNIPTRSALGHTVKTAFTVAPGSVFVAVDYSQIELRLLAHLSGDAHLIAAFNEGEDFHAETAARVFDVPVDEVTPALRSRAKAVNFGIVYGQQAYGLSQSLDIPQAEAREMIDRYFEAYPGVRTFLDRTVADAKQTGYAETLFGRRRPIPELKMRVPSQRAFGERTAMNHPMQGTAADIIKIAMVRVAHRLEDEGFAARMILQVHDELDFECPEDEVERLIAMVRAEMEGVVTLAVPLVADASVGTTWADAK